MSMTRRGTATAPLVRFSAIALFASISALTLTAAARHGETVKSILLSPDARLINAARDPANWVTHGGSYAEQRYSTLTALNEKNVGLLSLAWSYEFDTNRGQEATPLVVDGVMYTTSAWSKVFALNAVTGKLLWSYDPKVPGQVGVNACCDVVNRGLAYYDGKVYVGTIDGRLIGIDAKTGAVKWSQQTTDPEKPYTITGAPRIAKGKVFIGNGGAEYGVRGYITAYDAETGKKLWRFYTVPGDPAKGPDHEPSDKVLESKAKGTWFGKEWITSGGGGTVWDAISYDPELDQLYIGVGNGSPWDRTLRSDGKGDNLFLSSIVAVKPETGEYLWHYQESPGDSWDFTATSQMVQATLQIDGKAHKVLMQAPKSGFFYVIDRETGKLLSAKNYVPTSWATHVDMATGRPVMTPNAHYDKGPEPASPGALGGHDWQPISFSPKTGLVYIPTHIIPLPYAQMPPEFRQRRPIGQNVGMNQLGWAPPDDAEGKKRQGATYKGYLMAWDPVAQKEVWRANESGAWNGGALSTAGNLVFAGNRDGQFQAFRATDGKKLWSFQGQSGIMAGPVTYSVGGQQYVAVLAGFGGVYGLASGFVPHPHPQPNGRVLVFRIGGKAKLPAEQITYTPAIKINEPTTPEQMKLGYLMYESTCAVCHGLSVQSSGVLPDLRRSAAVADKDTFYQILLHGALQDQGMVNFSKILKPADVDAIRAYIASKARIVATQEDATGKPKGE